MEENREAELFHDVAQLAKNSLPFIVRTKNFSAFKPRTIFIDVEKNIALNSLKENVDDFFKPNNYCKIKVDSRPFHPHITIATRDLFKKIFYEAWPVFEKEIFEEEWIVDGLSVLRHNKKNWDVVYTSQFVIGSKA
jgi:2'-5' RNA ligase